MKGISTKIKAGMYGMKLEYCLSTMFEKAKRKINVAGIMEINVEIDVVTINNLFEIFIRSDR